MDAGKRTGDSFTAPENMIIKRILVYLDGDNNPLPDQYWKVSLQTSNPITGLPSGTELAGVVRTVTETIGYDGAITQWNFTENVKITRGIKYWIVSEFVSGTPPSGSQTLYLVHNTVFTPEGMSPDQNYKTKSWFPATVVPVRNVWGQEDYSWQDTTYRRYYYNGSSWSNSSRIPVTAVETEDGIIYGSVHRHKFTSLRPGTEVQAEQFKVIEQNITVNQLTIGGRGNGNPPPNVNIKAELLEGDANINKPNKKNVIWSMDTFIDSSKLWGVIGNDYMTLYTQYINPPITLEKNKYYMLVLSADGLTSGAFVMDMAGPRDSDFNSEDPLYGASRTYESQDARSYAAGSLSDSDWSAQASSSRHKYDLPVPMKLVGRYQGEFTTKILDADGEDWVNISFSFELEEQGTKVKAHYSVSDDNLTWDDWIFLNGANNLSSDTIYELPFQNQKRYIQIKGILSTDDPAYTPILHSLTVNSSLSPVDTIPPTIVAVDPVNNSIEISVNKNITVVFSENIQAGSSYGDITLTDSNNINIGLSKNIGGNVLSVTQVNKFSYDQHYTLSIPAEAVKDFAGNSFTNSYSFGFTTTKISAERGPYVFPVPFVAGKNAQLTFGNLAISSEIEIYSIDGVLILKKEVSDLSYSFIPNELVPGVYMYLIKSSKGITSGKIVIIK